MNVIVKEFTDLFKEKTIELRGRPEFQWNTKRVNYAEEGRNPCSIKLAVRNVSLDYDLWQGLRNPATDGLYPTDLKEI